MHQQKSKIIVALDYPSASQAQEFIDTVTPQHCALKVGKELFTSEGPRFVEQLTSSGFDVFLDLKFHDIPHTVNKAIAAACNLGVWMVNVHAMGGQDMMVAARSAVDGCSTRKPLLIAVSILTSMDQKALDQLGINKPVDQVVAQLTALSLESGVDGMVCSAQEVSGLRNQFGNKPLFVTPGIRPIGANLDDQHRIMTPDKAITSGASYLVIGRPITQHAQPALELERINESLAKI